MHSIRQPCGSFPRSGQAGFSLIEIVIAMFILMFMAMAVLPLLIVPMKASLENRSTVTATAFANATLESIRAEFPNDGESSCATVRGKQSDNVPDPAGTGLRAKIKVTPATCPALPGTLTVTVEVKDSSADGPLAVLATEIVVSTA